MEKIRVKEVTDETRKGELKADGKYRKPLLWWIRDTRVYEQVDSQASGEAKS